MKKLILTCILMAMSLSSFSQALHIFHDGQSTPDIVANAGIDSVYFEPKFIGSTEYQQVFVTKDGVKRYDVVDSVKFNLPHLTAIRHSYYIPRDQFSIPVSASSMNMGDASIALIPPIDNNWDYYKGGWSNGSHNGYNVEMAGFGISFWHDTDMHTEKWYLQCGEMRDSIQLHFTGIPIAANRYNEIGFSADEVNYTIDTNFPDTKIHIQYLNYKSEPIEGVDVYYNEDGKPVIHFSPNDTGGEKHVQAIVYVNGYCDKSLLFKQGTPFVHSPEEHMAALREFCDSTDFKKWGKDTNWWSDEPLWKWDYSINHGRFSDWTWLINDHIVSMFFGGGQYTGVHGTIPASFEIILDDLQDELNFGGCALYGVIPYNVRHSKNWSKYGWNFIMQDPWYGGGFDMEDINLRMENEEIMYADGTKTTAYDELAKHKLTFVSIGAPNEAFCNLCLAYANKGFEYIYATQDWLGGTLEGAQNAAKEFASVPNVLVCYQSWANGNLCDGLGALGSTFLLDSAGYVIDYALMNWGIDEDIYTNRLGKHLLKYLGEPEEHEPYIPKPIYTSTDYSRDGEVLTLQKASVGKGIDLVFMGDMYVDTLLVEGAKYEADMRAAMEYFFEIEPYKTLRDRFNVYMVKAVSPNGAEGSMHKFNYNNDLVFEYAQKVPDVDMEHLAVTVIHNNENAFFVSGETGMWESGASIAWIEEGGPSSIICHETGGHGVAKLLDEYIYGGYEENHTQEGAEESFREWKKTAYHDKGWGMNISATDDPEEVPWAHFLKDERYKDEVGIYQGAWFWPEELWRPSENSVMKDASYLWFNAPSREAIYKKVMQLSEGDDWTYDYEKFVEFDTPIREAHKQAMAKARKKEGERQEIQKHRIELRPPTIYKGSWRDAGKGEKAIPTEGMEQFVTANNGGNEMKSRKVVGVGGKQDAQRPYILYKGERIDADKIDRKDFFKNPSFLSK